MIDNSGNCIHQRKYCNGEEYFLLGETYFLEIQKNSTEKKISICISEEENKKWILRTASTNKKIIRDALVQWYRYQAKKIIHDRVYFYQPYINEKIGTIRIKEQKTRWGSCSSKGNLNFNWKCVMAPIEMLDYIVVHELCHLKQMNHSKAFWCEVEKVLPDYKKRDLWWKEHGKELELDYIWKRDNNKVLEYV